MVYEPACKAVLWEFESPPGLHSLQVFGFRSSVDRAAAFYPAGPGFDSSRKRQRTGRVSARFPKPATVTGYGGSSPPAITIMEGWQRGLMQRFAKSPTPQGVPGFESPPFRQSLAGITQWQSVSLPSCSSGVRISLSAPWSLRLSARISVFHTEEAGSTPAGTTNRCGPSGDVRGL